MIEKRQNTLRLFGNVKVMTTAAMLVALSVVLKVLAINLSETVRIGFENLPVLMAGIFFGPLIGGCVGAAADIIGCIIKGFSINPIITLGCFGMGFVSGFMAHVLFKGDFTVHKLGKVAASVMSAHVVGSMLIKSAGMAVYYGTPLKALLIRVPIYIGIGTFEFMVIFMLMSSSIINSALGRLYRK